MNNKNICFVVNELYPLHKGGIGRWIFNLLSKEKDNIHYHIVLYGDNFSSLSKGKRNEVIQTFSGIAQIYFLEEIIKKNEKLKNIRTTDTFDDFAFTSMKIYECLKSLYFNRKITFDFVEFIDYGGPAFFTTQARKTQNWLRNTQVSVRLHSTNSIITHYEAFNVEYSSWHYKLHDIERKALQDTDIVVTHIDSIAQINKDFYNFPVEWNEKIVKNFPIVLLDEDLEDKIKKSNNNRNRFVFTSRLAPFKQPDLFIRAAIMLLDENFDAEFILASYGWDNEYSQKIKKIIPEKYKNRIVFMSNLSEEERLEIINSSTVVIPSNYESFCFLAFEALLREQSVILNSKCPAFGSYDFWQDQKNCLFFDGTVRDLAKRMKDSVEWKPVAYTLPECSEPYWKTLSASSLPSSQEHTTSPNITFVSFGNSSIQNVLSPCIRRYGWKMQEIQLPSFSVRDIDHTTEGDGYICFLSPNIALNEDYILFATNALEQNPEYVGIVPQYQKPNGELNHGLNGGNLVACSVADISKIGIFGAVFRKSFLRDKELWNIEGEYWLHSGICQAVLCGRQLISSPEHFITLYAGDPDPIKSSRIVSGIFNAYFKIFYENYNACIPYYKHYKNHESQNSGDELRDEILEVSKLARDRFSAMIEMENMIIERDSYIKHIENNYNLLIKLFFRKIYNSTKNFVKIK